MSLKPTPFVVGSLMSVAMQGAANEAMNKRRRLPLDPSPGSSAPLRLVHKSLWARHRRALLAKHGMKCMACGYVAPETAKLEGHEVHSLWDNGLMQLEKVVLYCLKCHHVVHLERSLGMEHDRLRRLPGATPKTVEVGMALYRDVMMAHYCEVNRVSPRTFERDWEAMLATQRHYLGQLAGKAAPMHYGPFHGQVQEILARRRWGADDPEPEWWEFQGIDPGEAEHMWWLNPELREGQW